MLPCNDSPCVDILHTAEAVGLPYWDIRVHGALCCCGPTRPVDLLSRRNIGCAKQPLLLCTEGLGVTIARMLSAALQSALTTRTHRIRTVHAQRGGRRLRCHTHSRSSTLSGSLRQHVPRRRSSSLYPI